MTTPRGAAATNPVPGSALRAPRLPESGPWFNGGPVSDWRGRVTLVDFWTYSCINCLRTLPALRAWHARYAALGLIVLGIHTPEFPFEREPANVALALGELGIAYPVVLDNDRALWDRFANRFWPHRYLIDPDGRIVHDHAGEGSEAATERAIRALLAARPGAAPLPPPAFGDDADDAASVEGAIGAVCVPGTPELFAGYYRGVSGNPGGFREDRVARYTEPGGYREGYIHLAGTWRVDADAAHFVGPEPGSLRLAFRGTAPNVVLAPASATPIAVAMRITAPTAEEPALPASPAAAIVTVDAPRLYRLPPTAWAIDPAALPATALRLLTLVPASPGLAVYSFTFGAC